MRMASLPPQVNPAYFGAGRNARRPTEPTLLGVLQNIVNGRPGPNITDADAEASKRAREEADTKLDAFQKWLDLGEPGNHQDWWAAKKAEWQAAQAAGDTRTLRQWINEQ